MIRVTVTNKDTFSEKARRLTEQTQVRVYRKSINFLLPEWSAIPPMKGELMATIAILREMALPHHRSPIS
jgi:hypothetical protein